MASAQHLAVWLAAVAIITLRLVPRHRVGALVAVLAIATYAIAPWAVSQTLEDQRLDDYRAGGDSGDCDPGVDSFRLAGRIDVQPDLTRGDRPMTVLVDGLDRVVAMCIHYDFVIAMTVDRDGVEPLWEYRNFGADPIALVAPGVVVVEDGDGLVGLDAATGGLAWSAAPCATPSYQSSAWYFPGVEPEPSAVSRYQAAAVMQAATGMIEWVERFAPDGVPLLLADPRIRTGDTAGAQHLLRERYGLPDTSGNIVILCENLPEPNRFVVVQPTTGALLAG